MGAQSLFRGLGFRVEGLGASGNYLQTTSASIEMFAALGFRV